MMDGMGWDACVREQQGDREMGMATNTYLKQMKKAQTVMFLVSGAYSMAPELYYPMYLKHHHQDLRVSFRACMDKSSRWERAVGIHPSCLIIFFAESCVYG